LKFEVTLTIENATYIVEKAEIISRKN